MIYRSRQAFAEAIDSCGLEQHKQALLDASMTGVYAEPEIVHDVTLPVGSSKFGGWPDLPPGQQWPVCKPAPELDAEEALGLPLWFLGQLDCDELRTHGIGLPTDSILSFFAAVHRRDYPESGSDAKDEWRVFIFKKRGLERACPPAWETGQRKILSRSCREWVHSGGPSGPAARMRLNGCVTLPQALYEQLVAPSGYAEDQGKLRSPGLEPEGLFHFFGGNCVHFQTGSASNLAWQARDYMGENPVIPAQGGDLTPAQLMDDLEWVNLAMFPTDPRIGLIWNYWAIGYFLIRKQDLVAGAFDRAVLLSANT